MARKLTIHDIARLAGVSKSMVSCVLSDSITVDPITCERVHYVIAERDVVPDQTAMQLANGDHSFQGHFSLTTVRQPFHEIGQCAAEMVLSLLDPRFVPPRNWWAFALPRDTEERARTGSYNWPSYCIQLLLTLTVRNACGFVRQSPYQNTS